tara:strand:- start:1392 stop:1859 length:468 start_codon:yes stop_codon:yes gene_type:complete
MNNLINGVFVNELVTHSDDRGFFRELLRIPFESSDNRYKVGQISHSEVLPNILKAWHAHLYQYQWTYIAKGNCIVALADRRKNSETFDQVLTFTAGDSTRKILYGFPPGVYHGYKNLGDTAQVIYITSGQYDLKDELRLDPYQNGIDFSWSSYSD